MLTCKHILMYELKLRDIKLDFLMDQLIPNSNIMIIVFMFIVTVYYSSVIVTVRQLRHFKIGVFI